MKTVTILGAAGRFGEACAQAFVADGWHVRGIARGAKLQTLANGVEPVECDALDLPSLIKACEGSDVIVHGLNPPAYDQWEKLVLPFGRNVLAAARATGARVMMPGNVYNFGKTIGMDVDEDTPFAPDTPKALLRIELEAMFADAHDVRTTIIRGGDFLGGARDGSWLDLMILKDLKKGKFTWPGDYDVPHCFAYLPDFADAFVKVANQQNELSRYEVFHFEGFTMNGHEMKQVVEAALGRSLKQDHMPWWLLRMIGIFNPVLKAVVEMSYLWFQPHSLDGTKLEALIDVRTTPPVDALCAAIADLKLDTKNPG